MIGISWGIFNRGLYALSVFKEVPYGWFNRSVFISSAVDCGSSPSWVKPKTIDWYLLILR